MAGLVDLLVSLTQRVQMLEHRLTRQVRPATVAEVDTVQQRVRVLLSEPGEAPFLSPPIPYGQFAAPGAGLKVHTPMRVGQSVAILAPAGELRQAMALPLTWSDTAPSPGTGDHSVLTGGNWTIEAQDDEITVTVPRLKIVCGAATVEVEDGRIRLSGEVVEVRGETLRHNDLSVGDTHKHSGVRPGDGITDIPV